MEDSVQDQVDKDKEDKFRVLAIDSEIYSLQLLCAVLHNCKYTVKTTTSAAEALKILTATQHRFDVVLVDVDSTNLNGFKLLEAIGLELYLPVIMLTGDGSLENVTRGLLYGAVDYIIKPIGERGIRNTIWHCVALNKLKESEQSSDDQESTLDDQDLKSLENSMASVKDEKDNGKFQQDDAYSGTQTQKKKRVVWTPDLDAKFLKAVEILAQTNKVHPKRILEIMNVPGLTRDHVASHLQKYRISFNKRKLSETSEQSVETRSIQRRKSEVCYINADRLAIPRFNGFNSSGDTNSISLNQIRGGNTVMSQCMIPYGSSLVPNSHYRSFFNRCLDDPINIQTPNFNSFEYYNYCLEMNIQPHNHDSQPVSVTTYLSSYPEPSISSIAPIYPPRNAFSVSNKFYGGIGNYAGFSTDYKSEVQHPGSTLLSKNWETNFVPNGTMTSPTDRSYQHSLEHVDKVTHEMDNNQDMGSLEEKGIDIYSFFNDDYHPSLTI